MSSLFQDLMTGLDEVAAFLSGKREGYKVTLPEEVAVITALHSERSNMTNRKHSPRIARRAKSA